MNRIEQIFPEQFITFFIFPFGFKSEINFPDLKQHFKSNQDWHEQDFSLTNGKQYNEYLYFYPSLRELLFPSLHRKSTSAFFEYNLKESATYQVLNSNSNFALTLPLENIFLHLFDNGTGILSFKIFNQVAEQSLQKYLYFLDLGRRIYPPFINPEAKIMEDGTIQDAFKKNDSIHFKQCPSQIILNLGDGKLKKETFTDLKIERKAINSLYLTSIITGLLDSENFKYISGDYWPLVDDRMFIHTFYKIRQSETSIHNASFIKNLKNYFKKLPDHPTISKAAKIWYQMVFIDGESPSCDNDHLFNKVMEESSYVRWSNSGGFYGFSRYNSAFISSEDYIRDHFSTMYYRIALLLFFYRGSLISFSERAKYISELIANPSNEKKSINELQSLNENLLFFENKYWYKEITAQDQGIEIFDLWESKMQNQARLQEVKNGIKELFAYFEYKQEKKLKRTLDTLTVIGSIWAVITVAIEFSGLPDKSNLTIFGVIPLNLTRIMLYNCGWAILLIGFLITARILFRLIKKGA